MHGIVTGPDGAGFAGLAVSNGRDVVITGPDGRFELDKVTPFVVLTRPTGHTTDTWWLPADDDTELRFELSAHPQTLPFEFIHLTDTHLTVPAEQSGLTSAIGIYKEGGLESEIRDFLGSLPQIAPEAQAVFITGDLVDNGFEIEFERFTSALQGSPLPVHVIPGNHDHMNGVHGSVVSRNDYITNEGDPALYEKHLGPRWYSFDIPGAHVVTLDWHTHELGLDHELQNAWVKADLAAIPAGTPWLLLFHDQPGYSILDEVPWQPVAAFSGHWHTSRVVRVGETLHVNSPTTFFASLDYSPPAFRHVVWDGENITMRTETRLTVPAPAALGDLARSTFGPASGRSSSGAVLWRAELTGAAHRHSVVVTGDLVVAGTQIEDEPRGYVEALDAATGEIVWSTRLDSAVKTTPAVWGDTVIAAEVSGDVHGLNRETGAIRWTVASSDPLRRFAWNPPTASDGVVFIGDQSDLRAIDVETGEVLWRRTDLSPHHNLVNHAAPLVLDDLLVMGFWPTPQRPVGLDAHTGESRWRDDGDSPELFAAMKQLMVMGTASYDPERDAVLMPAFGRTACVDRATGAIRWESTHLGSFSPASPLVTPVGYLVTVTGEGLQMLHPADGSLIWALQIEGDAPFPMRSYSKKPHPVIARPTLVGERIVLPGLDGLVRVITLDGRLERQVQLASPLAGALEPSGDRLIGVGTDGNVVCLSVAALLGDGADGDAVAGVSGSAALDAALQS